MLEDKTERCLRLAREEHHCPHCNERLSCCEAPPFHIGDGLGWGTDILFICLNNECSLYVKSWGEFEERYGKAASCRYVLTPGATKGEAMMVGSSQAFTGSVVDVAALERQNKRYAREKKATEQLATCVEEKNLEPALHLLLDEHADIKNRFLACEMLLQLNDLACIDPLRNHVFRHTELEQQTNLAIKKILKSCHRKECSFCAELIKSQAKVCKHCGKDV